MIGSAMATSVTRIDHSTVLRRPILFIRMPVGTEKIRNQKNTMVVDQVGGSVGETELGLHVVRRGADQVDEAHDEEGEHHRAGSWRIPR